LNPVHAAQQTVSLESVLPIAADALPFPDAVPTGPGVSGQSQTLQLHVSSEAAVKPDILLGNAFAIASTSAQSYEIGFAPNSAGDYSDTLLLQTGVVLGGGPLPLPALIDLDLTGRSTARQVLYVNEPGLVSLLTQFHDQVVSIQLTKDELDSFSSAKVQSTADAIYDGVKLYFSSTVGDAVDVERGAGIDGTMIDYSTKVVPGPSEIGPGQPIAGNTPELDDEHDITSIVNNFDEIGNAATDYLFPEAINSNRPGESDVYLLTIVNQVNAIISDALANANDPTNENVKLLAAARNAGITDNTSFVEYLTAEIIAHEAGHSFGLEHLSDPASPSGNKEVVPPGGVPDIMSYNDPFPKQAFVITLDALRLALDQNVTHDEVSSALNYYYKAHTAGAFSILPGADAQLGAAVPPPASNRCNAAIRELSEAQRTCRELVGRVDPTLLTHSGL
jgi:hypothetical protein